MGVVTLAHGPDCFMLTNGLVAILLSYRKFEEVQNVRGNCHDSDVWHETLHVHFLECFEVCHLFRLRDVVQIALQHLLNFNDDVRGNEGVDEEADGAAEL